MSGLRQDRCTLCGGPNDCGGAAGKSECSCENVTISRRVLEKVPEEAKGRDLRKELNLGSVSDQIVHLRIVHGPTDRETQP